MGIWVVREESLDYLLDQYQQERNHRRRKTSIRLSFRDLGCNSMMNLEA